VRFRVVFDGKARRLRRTIPARTVYRSRRASIEQRTEQAPVRIESAKLTLPGNRQDNQDRVDVLTREAAALLVVVDGMGGHAEGGKAAEVTVATLKRCFAEERRAVFDPQGF